jgi:integrase/recombinase XerD
MEPLLAAHSTSQRSFPMKSLRERMTEDMRLRNLAWNTQDDYLRQVSLFARYFKKSPELLGTSHIREYQVYMVQEKHLAPGSIQNAVAALRFLYRHTLHKNWIFENVLPAPKVPHKLPVILSPEEVQEFLGCVQNIQHRMILSVCYAAGLRISEAIHLKLTDIDSKRMVIRVEQGKGNRDRYVMLSPKLLDALRAWWRVEKPKHWMFPGDRPNQPVTVHTVQWACQRARRLCHFSKPVTPHSLRHAFAVHLLEAGTDVRTIQMLLGHRSLRTTAQYLQIATSKVCETISPFDRLPVSSPDPSLAPQ